MPEAKSLADLMRIRAHEPNRRYLDSINGSLGTALGFRRAGNETISEQPAILVFVPEKINRKWIPGKQLLKSKLNGPNGLECPLDVVSGGRGLSPSQPPLPSGPLEEWLYSHLEGFLGQGLDRSSNDATALRLRGFDDRIYCGSQISAANSTHVEVGTLGLFVFTNGGTPGFLTNHHVAIGSDVYHPWARGSALFPSGTRRIGTVDHTRKLENVSVAQWYGPFASEPSAVARVDAAFVELDQNNVDVDTDISVEPLIEGTTVIPGGPFGSPLDFDNQDLERDLTELRLIGMRVYHVGRTTGLREGYVWAFGYEWKDELNQTSYADLLISGESIDAATGETRHEAFSAAGDSGTAVFAVRDGVKRPVGLLWGGGKSAIRGGTALDHWSYVTRLSPILDRLNLTIVTDDIEFV